MQQQQSSSPSATSTGLLGVSWQACVAYVCTLLIALALPVLGCHPSSLPGYPPIAVRSTLPQGCSPFRDRPECRDRGEGHLSIGCPGRPGCATGSAWRAATTFANDGCCPECGNPFQRSDAASSVPVTRLQERLAKVLAACDSWPFYLANLIGCGIAAYFFTAPWIRVAIACVALPDLYWMIRRIRKGPADYGRMFRETDR